ncbi:hypothetical protein [Pseudobythopirellula maris]|uniref:hypothetical protein n=1 Tax=Pseudobythopirellula maris TaxID=2527991 RepID=UPI0011B85D94|nr:hypothetical protein [Pseudobythopirellula maris]
MRLLTLLLVLLAPACCSAQKWVSPNYDNHHLDYRDLGYPGVSEIPADDSRISALVTSAAGDVYGATSGKQAYLFVFDRYTNKVRPLGQLPGAAGVHHTLVEGAEGALYAGTGLNLLDEIPLTKDFPGGHRQVEKQLEKDVLAHHGDYAGGKILLIDTGAVADEVYLPGDETPVRDLGVVAPRNSVYALTYNPVNKKLYGLTYPDALFFEVDPEAGQIKVIGPLLSRFVYSGPERTWRSVPRSLLCLENGDILTSGDDGLISRFSIESGEWTATEMRIPGEYWESANYYGYPVVEQLHPASPGDPVWGTTSDGFVFELRMAQGEIRNHGKPRVPRRVRASSLAADGELYMICGQIDEPCKLLSFDTRRHKGYKNWSYLSVDRSPYYAKRAYQFDAMTVGADGTVFIGESDRRGKLFLFTPGGEFFLGGLNPKNPR